MLQERCVLLKIPASENLGRLALFAQSQEMQQLFIQLDVFLLHGE
jgi:hypothetical protein